MKKFTKMMVGAAMLFGCVAMPLTGCSTMFGEDGFVITDMTWITDKENNVLITFKTTDDENPEVKVTIPHGLSGKEGVGIKSVTSTNKLDEEGNTIVTLVIKYTDEQIADTILSVPLKNGKDGKGVSGLDIKNAENGDLILKFKYTDGTVSADITIPKGKDGNSIQDIIIDDKSDSKKIFVEIKLTESEEPVKFEIPKGQNGVSLVNVTVDQSSSTDETIVFVLEFSDGFTQNIEVDRPQATIWLRGESTPENTQGKEGDFYLNYINGFVYVKENGEWKFLFSMDGTNSPMTYIVNFNPGDATWVTPNYVKEGVAYPISVKHGKYISLEDIPVVSKTGFNFVGWYTGDANDVNAGKFTDLTPVLRNMDLFPRWIAK